MTTDKMISRIKSSGFSIRFDDKKHKYFADRGILLLEANSITELYYHVKFWLN